MKLLLNYSGFSIITNIDKFKKNKYLLCMPQGGYIKLAYELCYNKDILNSLIK